MALDIKNIAAYAGTGPALSELSASVPQVSPGVGRARVIQAVLLGPQYDSFQGGPVKTVNKVRLMFELSGEDWPEQNGLLPSLVRTFKLSDAANSTWMMTMWPALNHENNLSSPLQAIDHVVGAEVRADKTLDGKDTLKLVLTTPIEVSKATRQTNDLRVGAPPATRPLSLFNFFVPNIEFWDSILENRFSDSGDSWNFAQNEVRCAHEFKKSGVADMLRAAGRDIWTDYENGQAVQGSAERNKKYVAESLRKKARMLVDASYFADASHEAAAPSASPFGAPSQAAPAGNPFARK